MTIGDKIKEIRVDKNLTQNNVANSVGVATSMVSMWENNINEPKASYITALSQFFNVSTDYLLGLTDDEYSTRAELPVPTPTIVEKVNSSNHVNMPLNAQISPPLTEAELKMLDNYRNLPDNKREDIEYFIQLQRETYNPKNKTEPKKA